MLVLPERDRVWCSLSFKRIPLRSILILHVRVIFSQAQKRTSVQSWFFPSLSFLLSLFINLLIYVFRVSILNTWNIFYIAHEFSPRYEIRTCLMRFHSFLFLFQHTLQVIAVIADALQILLLISGFGRFLRKNLPVSSTYADDGNSIPFPSHNHPSRSHPREVTLAKRPAQPSTVAYQFWK